MEYAYLFEPERCYTSYMKNIVSIKGQPPLQSSKKEPIHCSSIVIGLT